METKEAVTVAEMSRMCGLSRARFYQLLKAGIFPAPLRNETTQRPYYDKGQQELCLRTRQTNCGVNGKAVLFYAKRIGDTATAAQPMRRSLRPEAPKRTRTPPASSGDSLFADLRSGLAQLGVADLSDQRLRGALAEAFPDGHVGLPMPTMLTAVFRAAKRQNPPDNVAR